MNKRVAAACQTDLRSRRRFRRPRRGDGRTSTRVSGSQRSSSDLNRVVSVLDDSADLSRVRECEHEVQLIVAEVLHLIRACRHPRLEDIRLTDATESLSEQRLDRLDPRSVIRNGDLLPESLAALRAGARRPVSRVVLVAASSSTRRIVSTSSAAVSASAGRTADGIPANAPGARAARTRRSRADAVGRSASWFDHRWRRGRTRVPRRGLR